MRGTNGPGRGEGRHILSGGKSAVYQCGVDRGVHLRGGRGLERLRGRHPRDTGMLHRVAYLVLIEGLSARLLALPGAGKP